MSDETIHLPAPTAERSLTKFAWGLLLGLLAKPMPTRNMHIDELASRDRADLGLRNHQAWRTDPRPPSYLGPNGR